MSQYFDMGDETLWNPSNGASRLFRRQVALFEAELELPSGIGPMDSDACQVDPIVFGSFANALLEHHRHTHHAVMMALSEGFVVTVLALAERAGIELRWDPPGRSVGDGLGDVQVPVTSATEGEEWVALLRQKIRELDRFMAR